MKQENLDDLNLDAEGGRFSVAFAVLFFVVGAAAGLLLAFSGFGFLSDSATTIAAVFLVIIGVVGLGGIALFALRRRILKAVFGIAEAQVNVIAGPLADVAQGAARRDPEGAAQSARRLIQVALARYAWLATRRWILTTLTALIAAMAALAGTALLFKQNALIAEQIVLLDQQTQRITRQTALLEQQTELAEAARNAALSVEVTGVAALLGEAADRSSGALAATGRASLDVVPTLDPVRDLERSLLFRIIAVSQALRPYRFLDPGIVVADDNDRMRVALRARRDDLPQLWNSAAALNGWAQDDAPLQLIDRPASPERGQLLRVMLGNGLRQFEVLNFYGLDLTFAQAQGLTIPAASMQTANMAFADLSYGSLVETDLSGANLSNARLRHAQILRSRLGVLLAPDALPPLNQGDLGAFPSRLTGTDFTGALVVDSHFSGADALASVFDGALMVRPDFTEASLGAASFRGTVLVAPVWTDAFLTKADFDGAVVFGADPLAEMAAAAFDGTFNPALYRADPADLEAVLGPLRWADPDAAGIRALTGDAPAWRLTRLAALE